MQITVAEWLRAIPDFAIAPGVALVERGGGAMMTLMASRSSGRRRREARGRRRRLHRARPLATRSPPDPLTFDNEGYVSIRDAAIDVPADQLAAAEDPAGTCPEQAITLIAD